MGDGQNDGFDEEFDDGLDDGLDDGFDDGLDEILGFTNGFEDGSDDGLDEILGFTDGFEDAMAIAATMQYNHNAIQGEEGAHGICLSSFAINFLHSATFFVIAVLQGAGGGESTGWQ
jgi:hypothetical protein